MTPEEKEILEKTLELAKENNEMLHSLQRNMLLGRIWKIVYIVLIIGAAAGALYFIEPYIDSVLGTYNDAKSSLNGLGDLIR